MAGSIGVRNKLKKYENKFQQYYDNGYDIGALGLEITGGMGGCGRGVIRSACGMKATRLNKEVSVLINNTYIEYSIATKKLLLDTLRNHFELR